MSLTTPSLHDQWNGTVEVSRAPAHFLYLRGEPGTGKYTIAKLLQAELGWTLFWLHDLDPIFEIVGNYRTPRLIDQVVSPILNNLLQSNKNIIFVRPSRDAESVRRVRDDVGDFPNYTFNLIQLTADYDTKVNRVCFREHKSKFRVSTRAQLAEYLCMRPNATIEGETLINTTGRIAKEVATQIKDMIYV